jgi:hypothetical protein
MTREMPLAVRFYRLKSRHAPMGVYVKRFGHRDDDKCLWCTGAVTQTQEHLFCRLQPVETPPERTMEGVEKGNGLESGQMQACADL